MKLRLKPSCIALAASGALAISPAALAQSSPTQTDPARGDAVVVTGSATPVTAEQLGQSITVIHQALIEDQGYVYVSDVLRQVPGAAISQSGAPGAVTQVRVRGGEANHTLVLLDGFDLSTPDTGETDFSTLLTAGLSRLEVLRGPQSGLYGSNALGGVVNLVSRGEIDGHVLGASLEAGSFNTVQVSANAGIGNGDAWASADASRLTTDGYDVSPDQTANGVPAVGVGGQPGDKEGNAITTFNLRGGVAVSDMLLVKGVARYLNADSEVDGQAFGFPIPGQTYDDASSTEHEQLFFGASANIDPFDGGWETTLSASRLDETRINRTTEFPFLFGPPAPTPAELAAIPIDVSITDSSRTTFGVQSTVRFGVDGFANFITGFAEREEETFENTFTGRDESRTINGYGLQYRAEIADQLNLYVTGRHDDNDAFQDVDTYSLAAAWQIPGANTRLHASYGTGVTNPTFVEQFGFDPGAFPFIGNVNLVPEESVGWDFGVEHSFFGEALVVDLTWFQSTLENEIFTDFIQPNFEATPLNRPTESDRSGWELYFTAAPMTDLSLAGSWTTLDATDLDGIEIRRPEQQGSLDGSWRIGGGPVQLNLGVSYTGDMYDTDFGTFQSVNVGQTTLVRLGAAWDVSKQVEIYGRVENLLDEDYQEVLGYNAARQAFYLGIRFRDEATK